MDRAEKMVSSEQNLQFNNGEIRRKEAKSVFLNEDKITKDKSVPDEGDGDGSRNEIPGDGNADTYSSEEDRGFIEEYNYTEEIDDSDNNQSMDEVNNENDQSIHEIDHDNDQSVDEVDSDSDQSTDDDVINDRFNSPLYTNAPLSIHESMVLILCFFLMHNVTQTCLSDLILLINLHCLPLNLYKNSLFKFKRYFSLSKANTILKHYYCTWCHKKLEGLNDNCTSCPRRHKKNVSYFVEVNIISQLREMFKRPNFYNDLQCRFHLQRNPNEMVDIYDSKLYKSWFSNGFFQNPSNISFTWYTDGVPVYKSSKVSMWPIYLVINELPFEMRMERENMLLAAIWYGPQKPDFSMFFDSLTLSLTKMKEGITVKLSAEERITVRGILLFGTCDLPAKADCLNLMHHNGEYGCPVCLHASENVETAAGNSRIYRYSSELPPRTLNDYETYGNEALRRNQPVMGVKGPTLLSKLMPDIFGGTAIDKMHNTDKGNVQKLCSLWFDVEYRNEPFSLYDMIDVINERLCSIKPPKYVHRMPRSISELINWKASEFRLWFFFYSFAVLNGIMRPDYFEHYLLLLNGISLLNANVITNSMIEQSRELLHKFVREFESKYDPIFCSINIHLLLHLPDSVINTGPLWAHSCYKFEDINGKLLKQIHGTSHIDTQLANGHCQLIKMEKFLHTVPAGPISNFCKKKKKQVKINEKIFDRCYVVGTYSDIEQEPSFNQAIRNYTYHLTPTKKYLRLMKDSKLFIAQQYKNQRLQTESSYILYLNSDDKKYYLASVVYFFTGTLNCFCEENCACIGNHFAFVKPITGNPVTYHNLTVGHIFECNVSQNCLIIPVEWLSCVCFHMFIDKKNYVIVPMNDKELE